MTQFLNQQDCFFRDESNSMREGVRVSDIKCPEKPRFLLVDDDPFFSQLMQKIGDKLNLDVKIVENADKLLDERNFNFDVLIVDYDLGNMNGYEVADIVEKCTFDVPTILISGKRRYDVANWPDSIREFVHKNLGAVAILDAAIEAYQIKKVSPNNPRSL